MRRLIIRLCRWTLRRLDVFQPCVIRWNCMGGITELLMEDAGVCYCPLPVGGGHCVDLGYGSSGKLVAVKIWADVTTREKLNELRSREAA